MTTTHSRQTAPRASALDHRTSMALAETEYRRITEILRPLEPDDWAAATDCPGWRVREVAAHALGMVEMAASLLEQRRQMRIAQRTAATEGTLFIDALTALQVAERTALTSDQIVDGLASRAPKAVRGRRTTPSFVRRRRLPIPGELGGTEERWTIGYLTDTILTRDPWMHRIDIARATGADHVLTPEHDGVIVADVVAEWADRHGRPFTLRLTGPVGGEWSSGSGGHEIELDAIEFTRILAGRAPGTGLLATLVPF